MLKIYTFPLSTPALSVLFCAHAAGGEFENITVDMTKREHKSDDYLTINPLGKVPAMVDEDAKGGPLYLSESAVIMRYIARREGSSLLPSDTAGQARVEQWMDYIVQHLRTPFAQVQFNRMFAPLFGQDPNQAAISSGMQLLSQNLPAIERQLQSHKHVCGEAISLADILLTAVFDPMDLCNMDFTAFPEFTKYVKRMKTQDWYLAVHKNFGEGMESLVG